MVINMRIGIKNKILICLLSVLTLTAALNFSYASAAPAGAPKVTVAAKEEGGYLTAVIGIESNGADNISFILDFNKNKLEAKALLNLRSGEFERISGNEVVYNDDLNLRMYMEIYFAAIIFKVSEKDSFKNYGLNFKNLDVETEAGKFKKGDINIKITDDKNTFDGLKTNFKISNDFVVRGNALVYYMGYSPEAKIPASLKLTEIGEGAFKDNDALKSIEIPEGITIISESAFEHCQYLSEFRNGLPRSLAEIGDNAFAYCENLAWIDISGKVTKIGAGAFKSCSDLDEITFSDKYEKIGRDAFADTLWYKIQSDGVVCAGNMVYGYKGSMGLYTKLELPSADSGIKITGIADGAFAECSNLVDIVMPGGYTRIGKEAFLNCRNMTGVLIPSTIKKENIAPDAFDGCPNVTIRGLKGSGGEKFAAANGLKFKITCEKEHQYGDWITGGEPKCIWPGVKDRTCSYCGYIETKAIEPLGHDWSPEYTIDRKATARWDGSMSRHCKRCIARTDVTPVPFKTDGPGNPDKKELYIKDIQPKTTKAEFMGIIDEKYKSYAENIKIFAANGNEVTNNDTIMCTGMTVLLMDGGQIKESATVAVKGDVTGEGIASVADARMILRYAAGLDKFSDIQLLAGDLTGAGSVGAAEARTVLRYNAKLADRL